MRARPRARLPDAAQPSGPRQGQTLESPTTPLHIPIPVYSMDTETARFNMIEQQIRPWDVLDPGVLSLLAVVKREDFVPPAYRSVAFMDMEIPLPEGQCMLAPRVEARLLQELQLQRHEKVLEVGAGSGFMAALLAHRAQHVTTLEIDPELEVIARRELGKVLRICLLPYFCK